MLLSTIIFLLTLGAGALNLKLLNDCFNDTGPESRDCDLVVNEFFNEVYNTSDSKRMGRINIWPSGGCEDHDGVLPGHTYLDPLDNTCVPSAKVDSTDYVHIIWDSDGNYGPKPLHEIGFYKDEKCTDRVGSWTRSEDMVECISQKLNRGPWGGVVLFHGDWDGTIGGP